MTGLGIEVAERDGVRHVLLDRPEKKNALTAAMYAHAADALASAERDGVGALLLSARGDTFTAGNDLRDFLERPPVDADAPVMRFLIALATTDVPVVAAVRGAAVGVGTTLLLHCDLVYAAASARFRVPFVDLGLVPEAGSSVLLPRLAGRSRAAAMFLLGETLDAHEAAEIGLVTEIVDDAALDEHAAATARALAAKPRDAVRATKRLANYDRDAIVAAIRRESEEFGKRLRSDEARAAMAAFFAK